MAVDLAEYPISESDKRPECKEQAGNKLANIWRDAVVSLKSHDNADVDEVIQTHEGDETLDLTAGLAFASLVIEHPLFVSYKE